MCVCVCIVCVVCVVCVCMSHVSGTFTHWHHSLCRRSKLYACADLLRYILYCNYDIQCLSGAVAMVTLYGMIAGIVASEYSITMNFLV